MNPRTRLFRGLALTALLGVGLTACKEDTLVNPSDPTISAAPSSLELTVGQSQQIVGSVSDGSAVAFESLNTSVATVAASGNTATVTAVGEGSATIRVSSVERSSLQTAVNVVVKPAVLPPSDTADVTIQGIFQSETISPVDPDSVVNTIDIVMGVERGNADKLAVIVNGDTIHACTQTFTSAGELTAEDLRIGAANVDVVCSLDTRAFERVGNRGIPRFGNGPLEILATLSKDGSDLSTAQRSGFTLANSDRMDVEVASIIPGTTTVRGNVIGDAGLLWLGNGDLQFTVVPVIYSTGSESGSGYPAQVTIAFEGFVTGNDTDKANTQVTREEGGFIVTFPKASAASTGSAGLNTGRDGAQLHVSSVTNGGQPGPATVYSPFTGNPTSANRVRFFTDLQSGTALLNAILRFDNEAPQAGRLILPAHPQVNRVWARNGWVNDAVDFFTAKDGSHDAPFEYGGGSVGAAYTGSAPGSSYTSVYGTIPALSGFDPVYGVGQDSIVIYAEGTDSVTIRLGTRAQGASSAELSETLTNSEWSVFARVWDKLGNVSTVQIDRTDPVVSTGDYPGTSQTGNHSLIGVDLVAPDVELLYSDTTDTWSTRYNPVGDTISVWGLDTSLDPLVGPSGIAVTRLQNRAYSCTDVSGECMNVLGVVDGSTILATPGSNAWSITQSVGVTVTQFDREVDAISAQAYHDFRGKIFDRAGNESAEPTSALFIRDTATPFPPIDSILPLVSNVNIPPVPLFSGSETYSFSATVGDNVDVRRATAGFDFTDGTDTYRLPFANIDLTAWGTDHIVRSKLLNQDLQYIRQLSVLSDTVTADTIGRPTFARFVAFDHSNWIGGFSTQANNIVPNTWDLGGTSWFSPMQFASWHEVSAGQYRFTIGGPTGTFQTPFSRVLFYVRLDTVDYDDLATPLYYLIGAGAPPAIQDGYATIYRVFRYAIPTIPTEIVESGRAFTVVAVGINATGDALLSTDGPTRLEILGDAGI